MRSPEQLISVIIPAHDRPQSLRRVLDALAQQSRSSEQCEVIIVDDGSEEDLAFVSDMDHPFVLRYFRQSNRGATAARNAGARHSRGRLLVFLDDDIDLGPDALSSLVETLAAYRETIVLGDLHPASPSGATLPSRATRDESSLAPPHGDQASYIVPFSECMTGVLAIRREDFVNLGMFQDPTGGRGWPNWDDVDFGYRAHLQGYQFRRSLGARAYHRDHVLTDLETRGDRWRRAARAAVLLFQKYPELQSQIPMFRDKTPIAVGSDSPALILDKLFHRLTAWRPLLRAMEGLARVLEHLLPSSKLLHLLYRWTVSSYIYRGYREGLKEWGPIPTTDEQRRA
jgi:glycosyltransferase involved in cell wall biosynthesis